ncbi:hypothetical protein AYI68_g9 [Smittium mucronatum]|uniref:Uncharacterized protein n=1 Tax=Smittium mucronatum TaxID=133383 RepID=A0A1R0H9E9_9FUNG|nr:hypothetical protein AYI68_g9 [Smittium mucronatum]
MVIKKYTNFNLSSITSIDLSSKDNEALVGSADGKVFILDLSNEKSLHCFSNSSWEYINNGLYFRSSRDNSNMGAQIMKKGESEDFSLGHRPIDGSNSKIISVIYSDKLVEDGPSFLSISNNGVFRAWSLVSHSCANLSLGSTKKGHRQLLISENSSLISSRNPLENKVSAKSISKIGVGSKNQFTGRRSQLDSRSSSISYENVSENGGSFGNFLDNKKLESSMSKNSVCDNPDLISCAELLSLSNGSFILAIGYKDGVVRLYI